MDNPLRRRGCFNIKAFLEALKSVPEPFTPAQEDRHEDDMHVVYQAGLEELPDRAGTAANPDVHYDETISHRTGEG